MSLDELVPDFEKRGGLIVAITQEYSTGRILMQAYMNKEAYDATIRDGIATYWSTSRNELWKKGDGSGNIQIVKEVYLDCDLDAVVLRVDQKGSGTCHTGEYSCFYRKVADYRTSWEKIKDKACETIMHLYEGLKMPPPPGWFPAN